MYERLQTKPDTTGDLIDNHEAGDCRLEATGKHEACKDLFGVITSNDNFCAAWDHLERFGGQAPGPNGHRYADYEKPEKFELLRCLITCVQDGTYRPGPDKKYRIPKTSGKGHRELALRNIEDRVVERAVLQGIAPLFPDANNPDRQQQLATAEWHTLNADRVVWIVEDIKDAFTQVPHGRLLDVLRPKLPKNVLNLIKLLLASKTGTKRGLRQGSPISPLLMNVYLDHFLDRPWSKQHANTLLLRTMDDVLVLCRSVREAEMAYGDLENRLRAAGMPLKGSSPAAIKVLPVGDSAEWLGYKVTMDDGRLIVTLGDRSWRKLEENLVRAHSQHHSPVLAFQSILGWIDQAGPCFGHEDIKQVYGRIQTMAYGLALEEIPSQQLIETRWCQAMDSWRAAHELAWSRIPVG